MRSVGAERRGVDRILMPFEGDEARLSPRRSHTRAVLSSDAVTTRVPSGLNAAEMTGSYALRGRRSSAGRRESHTRAVLSSDAVTTCVPSGLNAAELTGP